MIAAVIRASVRGRFLVILAALALLVAGGLAVRSTPVDALPDLSDVQVVIRTTYPGQAPQIVENQVTYPLTTTMLSVPGAKTVRGYSFFGDSFVYVIFEDGTDLYWARSRVLEYLNQVQGRMPAGARPALGPDATGVGWIYEYALVDRTGRHDLAQLRSLQDWFLRYELKTVPGVAEVAAIGGMVKQYQVVLDPTKLAAYGVTHSRAVEAIQRANAEAGGSVLEMGEAEYMVRASGYLKTLDDFRAIPLRTAAGGVPPAASTSSVMRALPRVGRLRAAPKGGRRIGIRLGFRLGFGRNSRPGANQSNGEIAGMHRDELDLERKTWLIPAERTKGRSEHLVPLSDQAVVLIKEALQLQDARRKGASGFVFPSPHTNDAAIEAAALSHAMADLTAALDLDDVRLHDLRRTGATGIAALGVPPYIVSKVLAHKDGGGGAAITARHYNLYAYAAEKRDALDRWSAHLKALLQIEPPASRPARPTAPERLWTDLVDHPEAGSGATGTERLWTDLVEA